MRTFRLGCVATLTLLMSLSLSAQSIKVETQWKESALTLDFPSGVRVDWVPTSGSLVQKAYLSSGSLTFTSSEGQIKIKSQDREILASLVILDGRVVLAEGQRWPQRLSLTSRAQRLSVVFHLELEQYVANVLPHEMPLSWPEEALKAQVIAVRTYALYRKNQNKDEAFHLHSTTKDQVFKWGSVPPHWRPKLHRVIAETRGQVLLDEQGQLASIFYHADCGGATEQKPWVWGGSFTSSGTTRCSHHPSSPWKLKVSHQELASKLSISRNIGADTSIQAVSPQSRASSGRIKRLKVELDTGEGLEMEPEEMRKLLGYHRLRSTRFSSVKTEDGFEFSGTGYGHGVGLCQQGTKAWAQNGEKSSDILKIYYPDLKVGLYKDSLLKRRSLSWQKTEQSQSRSKW